jgi:hypothetical protein
MPHREMKMRDLNNVELEQVYGAGGGCGSRGHGSKKHKSGSHKSRSHKSRSHKTKSHKGSRCR